MISEVKDVELIGIRLSIPFKNNFLLPFEGIEAKTPPKTKLPWWQSYTNLKHSELENLKEGCLSNVVNGIATLAVLHLLMDPYSRLLSPLSGSGLFYQCGFYEPLDDAKKDLF